MKAEFGLFGLLLASSCTHGVILYEPTAVVVTARRPAPPPPPAPVVKRDRIEPKGAIYFDTDKATIRKESLDVLDDLARTINDHPELRRIRIEGHTDSVGSAKDNLSLSQRRAAAVRMYLIERGVDARRLVAEGFGGASPIASNKDEPGRQKNRRVVFAVVDRSQEGAS